jgi:hypothetical protein
VYPAIHPDIAIAISGHNMNRRLWWEQFPSSLFVLGVNSFKLTKWALGEWVLGRGVDLQYEYIVFYSRNTVYFEE